MSEEKNMLKKFSGKQNREFIEKWVNSDFDGDSQTSIPEKIQFFMNDRDKALLDKVVEKLAERHAETHKNCPKHPKGSDRCLECFRSSYSRMLIGDLIKTLKE